MTQHPIPGHRYAGHLVLALIFIPGGAPKVRLEGHPDWYDADLAWWRAQGYEPEPCGCELCSGITECAPANDSTYPSDARHLRVSENGASSVSEGQLALI